MANIVRACRTSVGMSRRLALFLAGRTTVPTPARRAASSFSLIPPTGRMRPVRVNSPLIAASRRQQISRLIRGARFYSFAALGGLVILSFLVFVFFLVNVNRPLKALENAIRDIASGHYENIPAISAGQEFASLVDSLNHMIDRLNRRSQELIQAKKMASLGTLTSGVAHELNNPLNNISTSLQIVLEELADDNLDFKRELLQGAEKEVERARDTVRALLEFSRQSAFSIKPVAIKSLVSDTIKLIKGELTVDVAIEVKIGHNSRPPWISAACSRSCST